MDKAQIVRPSEEQRSATMNPRVAETPFDKGCSTCITIFKNGTYAIHESAEIQVVDGDFGRDTVQWRKILNFDDKVHYEGGDQPNRVDLNSKYNKDLTWYGPNTSFTVDAVVLGEASNGSRIQLTVYTPRGPEQVTLKHFNQINKEIYDARGTGNPLKAGTYLGRTTSKVGLSTGPHLHGEVNSLNFRSDFRKWMEGR